MLVLVGRNGATAYELSLWTKAGKWGVLGYSRSALNTVPKRLEERGYLRSEAEVGKSGRRKRYHLTDRGIGAATEWLRLPPALPPVDSELLVRILGYDLLLTTEFLESFARLQPAIEKRRAQLILDELQPASPDADLSRRLAFSLHRRVLDAHSAWLKEVQRELRKLERGTR